jgi:hypothetical protein
MNDACVQLFASVAGNLAKNGLTDREIAKLMGTHPNTFQERALDFPEIDRALLEGRSIATKKIVNELFTAATGGKVISTVTEYRTAKGRIKGRKIVKTELAPDVGAMKHWLANVDKKAWGTLSDAPKNNTLGFFNINLSPEQSEADIERIKRFAGSLLDKEERQISTAEFSEAASSEPVQPNTDRPNN